MSVTDEAPAGDRGATPAGAPAKRRHTARNAAIAVGIVMVALIALLATRGTNEPISSKIVGQAAPAFSGETIDGKTFNLANHRGEWVLVNFFATWCVPVPARASGAGEVRQRAQRRPGAGRERRLRQRSDRRHP